MYKFDKDKMYIINIRGPGIAGMTLTYEGNRLYLSKTYLRISGYGRREDFYPLKEYRITVDITNKRFSDKNE